MYEIANWWWVGYMKIGITGTRNQIREMGFELIWNNDCLLFVPNFCQIEIFSKSSTLADSTLKNHQTNMVEKSSSNWNQSLGPNCHAFLHNNIHIIWKNFFVKLKILMTLSILHSLILMWPITIANKDKVNHSVLYKVHLRKWRWRSSERLNQI